MNVITAKLNSSSSPRKYAISTRPTEIIVQIFLRELQDDSESIMLEPGTLVRTLTTTTDDTSYTTKSALSLTIQILDSYNKRPEWDNLYKCNPNDFKKIDENLWPFIIAIQDCEERLQFAKNSDRIKSCLHAKTGDLVYANGEMFRKNLFFDCIIRYIGPVTEFGPGFYFGLELLNLKSGYSPQSDEILSYSQTYIACDAHLALILPANWVYSIESKKKTFFPVDLWCGTVNRAKSVLNQIKPLPVKLTDTETINNLGRQSSLRRNEPEQNHSLSRNNSARRSCNPVFIQTDSHKKHRNSKDHKKCQNNLNITGETQQQPHNMEYNKNSKKIVIPSNKSSTYSSIAAGNSPSTQQTASSQFPYKRNKATNTNFIETTDTSILRKSPNLSTTVNENGHHKFRNSSSRIESKDKSIQSDDNLINLAGEEYTRTIENYERNLEQKHNCLPVSILKHPKTGIAGNVGGTGSLLNNSNSGSKKKSNLISSIQQQNVKPNTIMSLEDRDIVVIDKADIKESTKNENSIIVLDNPRKEIHLAELLGSNWPDTAGDAALVLNTSHNSGHSSVAGAVGGHLHSSSSNSSSVSNYSYRNDRNKSGNPISHIGKNSTDRRNKENNKYLHHNEVDATVPISAHNLSIDGSIKTREKKLMNPVNEPLYDNTNIISSALPQIQQQIYQSEASSSLDDEHQYKPILTSQLNEIPEIGLGVGSMVEVLPKVGEDLYGVIRWIGYTNSSKGVMVGVELEDDPGERQLNLTDGIYNGIRLFKIPDKRAVFIHPHQCAKDRRFLDIEVPPPQLSNGAAGLSAMGSTPIASTSHSKNTKQSVDTKMFGQVECPPVPGAVAPLKMFNLVALEEICGKFKGIQGHHNSCYLDATLFAMFTFTSVFDSLLFRPPEKEDIPHYEEVQTVLREEIVNPLRKNVFVRADRVMKLRQLLEKLSSVSGLTCDEKDPEEFLNSLLAQIMRADPFLKLNSGQDTFFYQLFVEKDERLSFPSVQQLFEQSFLASEIKLREVPSCLIIQMPRFGKNFKMYPRILPSQVLDVTDIIEDSPRQCSVCGKLAEFECRECFGILQCGVGLESTAFCKKCLETVHSHSKRANHNPKEIAVPDEFKIMAEHLPVPRLFMELFAVVCIETSHYVAFVKAGSGLDAPWCFFDSMADRKGEQNGYNIPELLTVPDLPQWLSEDGARTIHDSTTNDKMLPEHAKRLLCDAYMCMYQSTDVMMYR